MEWAVLWYGGASKRVCMGCLWAKGMLELRPVSLYAEQEDNEAGGCVAQRG